MDVDDYDIDDIPCPACGHHETHSRPCYECEDGFEDEHDDDPVNCPPGSMMVCGACRGNGLMRWCPKCQRDYWSAKRTAEAKANEKLTGIDKAGT